MTLSWPQPYDPQSLALAAERWTAAAGTDLRDIDSAMLAAIFGNSPYLTDVAVQNPDFVAAVGRIGPDAACEAELAALARAAPGADLGALARLLRRTKRRVSLGVALADIGGAWDVARVTDSLSRLAETCLRHALDALLVAHAAQNRWPLDGRPERAGLTVLGMGKLGARELNYSSDIDLIVLYDHDAPAISGDDAAGARFVRLIRALVQLLSEITADGYVFRTDLRLRPDPGSTPLAMSTLAAETYYESVGQNWERAAMIKARPVAGALGVGDDFLAALRPYVWRKHLDFAAIHDIHSIKRQIDAHRGLGGIAVHGHDVKLGRGGIREIEFFAQTQQLIFGGRNPALRLRGTCEALDALAAAGLVAAEAAAELKRCYAFLRRVEHRVQMVEDRQTHRLPETDEGLARLATFLGYRDAGPFVADMLRTLRTVEGHYARLFEDAPSLASPEGNLVFTGAEDDPETVATLRRLGFSDPAVASGAIRRWHHGRYRATATARARELLTELMPALVKALAEAADPDQALLNFDRFLSNLPAGLQLFSLFKANPALLDLVATVLGSAPRLGGHLARRPILLDAVLSADFFAPLPDAAAFRADLARVLRLAEDEQEVLDAARRWTNDQRFRIGVQQLKSLAPPEAAGAAYADLATAGVTLLADRTAAAFERQHGGFGRPCLAILAMGRLGSRDMTATSDLDLMFVYDVPADHEVSDGERPLPPIQYYTRLSQRILNALTAQTNEGGLHEVDMRLRPSGNAGPLACSLEAFETYQRDSAWTWEHQALTRARVIHGPPDLALRLAGAVRHTLCRRRDPGRLMVDVADMRDRLANHAKPKSVWDFKHLRGGLFDIDFVAQFLCLHHAADAPQILDPHTGGLLRRLAEAGLLDAADARTLLASQRLMLALQGLMRLALDGSEADFDVAAAPAGLRRLLLAAAEVDDAEALRDTVIRASEASYSVYRRLIEEPARRAGFTPRSER